jgi:hypothetical protein
MSMLNPFDPLLQQFILDSGCDFDYSDFDSNDFQTGVPGSPATVGPYDFSTPQTSYGNHILYGGNYIIARVNGAKVVLTSAELKKLLDSGQDVLILGTVWEG